MKQLTRIEAVNEIIKIKSGERIATVGELETVPQAVTASAALDMATLHIQTDFKWFFNSIDNGELTSDNDGVVTLPDNLTFITFLSTTAGIEVLHLRPVDGKVYDIYNHTYNLGVAKTVRYCGKMAWDYEELPAVFQFLAIAHARKEIAGSSAHMSPQRLAIETQTYNDALQAVNKFDNTLSGGRVRDPMTNRRRPPYNRGYL